MTVRTAVNSSDTTMKTTSPTIEPPVEKTCTQPIPATTKFSTATVRAIRLAHTT